jgi:predicted alpha/beta-hydrolase family hydrolase
MAAQVVEIETPQGLARAHVHTHGEPVGALALGHGAGGSVGARDLATAKRVALEHGVSVVLVEQPYLVAGKKSTPRPPVLDEAWVAVIEHLRGGALSELPLVSGGRSSGARVACRTAAATGSVGVLALAFPLLPPAREPKSRLPELDAVSVPTLVVQGVNDRFGMPPDGPGREVVQIAGDHRLTSDLPALAQAIDAWLPRVLNPEL